jgi:hypothetical protein
VCLILKALLLSRHFYAADSSRVAVDSVTGGLYAETTGTDCSKCRVTVCAVIMSGGGAEVTELQSWLRSVMGEDADWEVTPDTLRILGILRRHNLQQEETAKVNAIYVVIITRVFKIRTGTKVLLIRYPIFTLVTCHCSIKLTKLLFK